MSESMPKVKSMVRHTLPHALMHTDSEEEARYKSYEEIFDEQGNVVEQVKYNPDGSEDERAKFEYDQKGRLVEERIIYELSESDEIRKIEYDDAQNIRTETQYYGGEPGEQVITRLNGDDDVVEVRQTDEEGELVFVQTIEYYKKGLVSEEKEMDGEGNLIKKVTSTYDGNDLLTGQEIESYDEHLPSHVIEVTRGDNKEIIESLNEDGKAFQRRTRKFNAKGQMIEFINEDYTESFNNRIQKLEYDDRDNIVKNEVFDMNGNLTRKQEFTYGEGNLPKEEIFFNNNLFTGNEHTHTLIEYEFYG